MKNVRELGGRIFYVVAKDVKKFKGILLLPDIDRFAVKLEYLSEASWFVKLLPAFLEVGKDLLQLTNYLLLIITTVIRESCLQNAFSKVRDHVELLD